MSEQPTYPFKTLGQRLKTLRQKLQETVDDVSGAIEVDSTLLKRYEQGLERPAEDILMLLISHFGMQEIEAAALWQLAGYELPSGDQDLPDDVMDRSMVLVMAIDPRVIYSDGVQVTANDTGVVLNFTQGGDKRQLIAARIGMSREQATNVMHVLQKVLQQAPHRMLPPSVENKNPDKDDGKKA
jgi:transcriptional regulator with XRE-family HTH domain